MNVVIGIISRCNDIKIDEVLISKRPKGSWQGDLWEFPGGKIETEEAEFDALRRELKEELDINVSVAEKVCNFLTNTRNNLSCLVSGMCVISMVMRLERRVKR